MDTTASTRDPENFKSEPPHKKIKRIIDSSHHADRQSLSSPSSTSSTGTAMESNNKLFPVQVDLSPAEQLLRKLLLDCRDHILRTQATINTTTTTKSTTHEVENSDNDTPKLEMWFVGGWVRDKLLGKQSADIDVALFSSVSSSSAIMSSSAFARHLEHNFLAEENTAEIYRAEAHRRGVEPAEIRGFYHIERNPGKGKHLETTSVQIFGLEVDFVNLRRDSLYQDQDQEQGQEGKWKGKGEETLTFKSAPEEDAFRRDANINAIFYNLETQQIEDHTKKGLIDIQTRVLRTPLDARITFTDDPLRILRLIRLASTLGGGFTIGDDATDGTQQAMRDPDIQLALRTRISRERIGGELKKMMVGPDPVAAFRWIYDLGLYETLFLDFGQGAESPVREMMKRGGNGGGDGEPWPSTWLRTCVALAELLDANNNELAREFAQTEDRESVWLMAAWSPLNQLRGQGNAPDGTIVRAAAKAISAPKKASKLLGESFKNMASIRSNIDRVNDNPPPARSTIGMAIRSWGVTWKLQILYFLLCELMTAAPTEENQQQLINRYALFLRCVSSHGLDEAPTLKPMLSATDIKTMFELTKSGEFMKHVFDAVLRWQFDHAAATREEAELWLRGEKARLNIPDAS